MYNPAQFREERREVLQELIRGNSLATLVSLGTNGLEANHLPLILDPESGSMGTLRGHVARANPVWKQLDGGSEVLAIFQGSSSYITPSWYATKAETGRVVPTYNYAVVYVRCISRIFEDPELLKAHVSALTNFHEAGFAEPWSVTDAPADYLEMMLKSIVGLEISITNIEGKWKMSQNRVPADRAAVSQALRARGDAASRQMAEWVLPPKGPA